VFCLFLTAISLDQRFTWLLEEHRRLIVDKGWTARAAHSRASASVVAMFLGMCTAWVLLINLMPTVSLTEVFQTVLDVTGADPGGLRTRVFANPLSTLVHNLGVMGGVVALCFVYRSHGAVLVLAWNASSWVVTLSTLTRGASEGAALSGWTFVVAAAAAIVPHLVLELAGYVLAALAAIFASKALTRYDWADPVIRDVFRSFTLLMTMSAITLAAAAVVEAALPALVFGQMWGGPP